MNDANHSHFVDSVIAIFRLGVNVPVIKGIGIQIKSEISITAEDIPISSLLYANFVGNSPCASIFTFAGAAALHSKDNVVDDNLESGIDAATLLAYFGK